jgi:hypothetical protein
MNEVTGVPEEKNRPEWKKKLNEHFIVKNIPFFLFLAILAVLYIYNGHYADKLVRKISRTEKNIKELQFEYKSVKSDVIFRSKASELAKAVEPMGLKPLKTPPVIIVDSLSGRQEKEGSK